MYQRETDVSAADTWISRPLRRVRGSRPRLSPTILVVNLELQADASTATLCGGPIASRGRTVRRHCSATSGERGRHYRVGLRPALRLALWSSHKRDDVAEVVAVLSTGVSNSGPSSRIDSYHPNETSQVGPRDERLASVGRPVDVPLSDESQAATMRCSAWAALQRDRWGRPGDYVRNYRASRNTELGRTPRACQCSGAREAPPDAPGSCIRRAASWRRLRYVGNATLSGSTGCRLLRGLRWTRRPRK